MKIRMTVEYDPVEYDPDCVIDPTKVEELLDQEKRFWLDKEIDIYDIEQTGGTVKFELIE